MPQLAAGAMIGRRPGGTLVNVGEAVTDEAVVPLSPSFKDSLAGDRQLRLRSKSGDADRP